MSRLTQISVQKKNPNRVNIHVDGRFLCGMQLATVLDFHLKEGMEIEISALARIQYESEKQAAYEKALAYAARGMKTEKQVRDYLSEKGYLEEVQDFALQHLKSYRYIDDEEYAREYVRAARTKGQALLKYELTQKGVGRDTIEEALSELQSEDVLEDALAVASKYMRGKEFDRAGVSKLYNYLRGRGYDGETVKGVLDALKERTENGEE